MNAIERIDQIYLAAARRQHRRAHAIRNSFYSATVTDLLFQNVADFTALGSFTAEASLLSGARQPFLPAGFFDNNNKPGRAIRLVARGVLSTTGTPTYTFQWRLGATSGPATLSGTSVGVSAAITTASGVTNKWWESCLDLICTVPGIGTGNCTLAGSGYVSSPGGFASPFVYPLEPTTPDTATWTATLDDSVNQYVNLSVTCSANSASNTLTLKQLMMFGLN